MLCPFLLSSVVGWFPVIFKMRNIYKYIYISFFLVALGLSCGMRVFTVSCVTFVAAHGISSCGAWVQLP